MLELADAFKKITHAKRRHKELREVFLEWHQTDGIQLVITRDNTLAKYTWFIGIAKEPAQDLSVLAGEIFSTLRSALDYVTWQIYLAGGGGRDEKRAKGVYFPIVTDRDKWEKEVKNKVPTAWPAAIELLESVQPFMQPSELAQALPALHAMNNPDKHRELSLVAIGNLTLSAITPDLGDDLGMAILMARPGPVLKLREGEILGQVVVNRRSDPPNLEPIPWPPGLHVEQPPVPQYSLAFRDEDGNEVAITAIRDLIDHVESIIDGFGTLPTPPSVLI
ncbi:hypothetical protein CJ179_36410 [Rhodococcus sp. ACS1]|uniref:hypothetical protein n=1 Tax=Rhodococcus sp. ACS1 TaxID=2028570 RepID=UPI000BB14B6A|nr:hypothetical protein [Rhodococcus sp. ACS1]PBC39505.1 hypothetical protein CJ179_36410 [Rhodococcus sp. ACS1]